MTYASGWSDPPDLVILISAAALSNSEVATGLLPTRNEENMTKRQLIVRANDHVIKAPITNKTQSAPGQGRSSYRKSVWRQAQWTITAEPERLLYEDKVTGDKTFADSVFEDFVKQCRRKNGLWCRPNSVLFLGKGVSQLHRSRAGEIPLRSIDLIVVVKSSPGSEITEIKEATRLWCGLSERYTIGPDGKPDTGDILMNLGNHNAVFEDVEEEVIGD